MKRAILLLMTVFLLWHGSAFAGMRKWEFVNPRDLEITIRPAKTELFAGELATFTISVRNRSDKPVTIPFATGQRWDMAAFHDTLQIWRWSQGLAWVDTRHSLEIPGRTSETYQLSWWTIDRQGSPLPQGIYRVQGMLMTEPRYLVSNMANIRLLPPRAPHKGTLQVRTGQIFEIEVPRYEGKRELHWKFQWEYNDNRLFFLKQMRTLERVILYFRADRRGHVILHLFGHPMFRQVPESVERQTYRIEIQGIE